MEFVVPYESGARRITSNLGSDLFCPLWLVGLAHLEWRARVARSSCIGRRWSVGCSPLVLDRSSWSVVGSFLKFGRNSTCCQYGGGNVLPLPGSSLSQLFGVDHLSSRSPLHRLGEGQGRGGKRLPRAALLPHCDRCLTGASALDFGHPHVEWKAERAFWAPKGTKVQHESNLAPIGPNLASFSSSTVLAVIGGEDRERSGKGRKFSSPCCGTASQSIWSIMLQRGCIRRHFGKTDPSMRPHGEWHHDFPRLGPKRRQEVLWRSAVYSLPPWRRNGAPFRLHFGHLFGHNQGVRES